MLAGIAQRLHLGLWRAGFIIVAFDSVAYRDVSNSSQIPIQCVPIAFRCWGHSDLVLSTIWQKLHELYQSTKNSYACVILWNSQIMRCRFSYCNGGRGRTQKHVLTISISHNKEPLRCLRKVVAVFFAVYSWVVSPSLVAVAALLSFWWCAHRCVSADGHFVDHLPHILFLWSV